MPARLSLLVVDDEESILFALRDFFERSFDVTCASSQQGVLDAMGKGGNWDVVITDLRLGFGGNEGLAIVDRIHRVNPRTAIFLLTAFETPETHAEALRLGARAVLSKPYPLPALEKLLSALSEEKPR